MENVYTDDSNGCLKVSWTAKNSKFKFIFFVSFNGHCKLTKQKWSTRHHIWVTQSEDYSYQTYGNTTGYKYGGF